MAKKKEDNTDYNLYGTLFEIGWKISLPLVIFVLTGAWLDNRYLTKPLFLLLGIFLSLFSSFYSIWQTVKNLYKGEK